MRCKLITPLVAMLIVISASAQSGKKAPKYHTFLGVDVESYSKKTYGLHINGTYRGYSAEKAGILSGDSLISINKEVVHNFDELVKMLDKYKPGDQVQLNIIRNESTQKIIATLSEYPDFLKYRADGEPEFANKGKKVTLGVHVTPVWDVYGGKIEDFDESSSARDAGLKEGDIIVKVDQFEFATQEELKYALSKYEVGNKAVVQIIRDGAKMIVPVVLREDLKAEKEKEKDKEKKQENSK